MNILLADDDNSMRLYFTRYLEKKDMNVVPCSSGEEAWERIQKEYFPLVLLDWNMSGMSGPEVCQRIKQNQENKYVYIILVTSRSSEEDIIAGLNSGADDYLTKPVIAAELEARLNAAFRVIEYENALREKELSVRFSCYRALTELAEKRDNETKDHMERVGRFCEILARKLGEDEEFCHSIRTFAPMHDIGKVGIPDGILHVPRSLYNQEYELIKLHTNIGWQILCGKPSFELAATIAYTHHEYWDGTGYPRHLKGNAIPLCGRICAIADCYDSLRCEKPYSPARNHGETMEWIYSHSGTYFDPMIVEAARAVSSDMEKIFDETYESTIVNHPSKIVL